MIESRVNDKPFLGFLAKDPQIFDRMITTRDIMTSLIVHGSSTDQTKRAMTVVCTNRVGGAPVFGGKGRLVGLIQSGTSLKSCFLSTTNSDRHGPGTPRRRQGGISTFDRPLVKDIRERHVITASPEAEALRPASIMALRRIRPIPVVEGRKLVGIVSHGDVCRVIFQDGPVVEEGERETRPAGRGEQSWMDRWRGRW